MMLALMRARFGLEENGVDVPTFLLRFLKKRTIVSPFKRVDGYPLDFLI